MNLRHPVDILKNHLATQFALYTQANYSADFWEYLSAHIEASDTEKPIGEITRSAGNFFGSFFEHLCTQYVHRETHCTVKTLHREIP